MHVIFQDTQDQPWEDILLQFFHWSNFYQNYQHFFSHHKKDNHLLPNYTIYYISRYDMYIDGFVGS